MPRIDVHHHFVPPSYLKRERERVLAAMALNPALLTESLRERLERVAY